MSDARDTLRALAVVDRCFAVWCAAQCARRCLHLVPEGEERPRIAIEAAEAWAREPNIRHDVDVRRAAAAAVTASWESDDYKRTPALSAAADAACAATEDDTERARNLLGYVAARCFNASVYAGVTGMDAAADILVTITAQRWPLVLPSLDAIRTAPGPLAVAWDRLAYVDGTISVAELLRAHEWATEQGLDWTDPVSRAVAERVAVTGDTAAAAAATRGAA